MVLVPPKTLFFDHGADTVIFLHSYTGSPNDFRALMRRFSQANISTYAPLFSGHGTNNPIDILTKGNVLSWWRDTQAAIDFIQYQKKNLLAVFGLSLGSIFALKALENYSQINYGGVFGSPLFSKNFINVRAGFFEYAQKIDQRQHLSVAQQANHQRIIKNLLPRALDEIAQEASTVEHNLNMINKSIFIGHGTKDKMVNYQAAKQLYDQLTTKVDFHLYKDAGHVITVNSARPQLEEDLLKFLKNN